MKRLLKLIKRKPYIGVSIALGVIGISFMTTVAIMQATYAERLTTWKGKLQSITSVQMSKFDTADASKTSAALTTLHDQLQAATPPTPAALFGLSLTPADQQKAKTDLEQARTNLTTQAKDTGALIAYQQQLTPVLQAIQTTKATNSDEYAALKTAWQTQYAAAEKVVPPAAAKEFHAKLISSLKDVDADIAALANLYSKQEVSNFRAAKVDLASHAATLRSLADEYKSISSTADTAFKAALKAITDR